MTYRKKLIEVALPLDEINAESAREKSIRHGTRLARLEGPKVVREAASAFCPVSVKTVHYESYV